jgi:hypothetical protein
MNQLSSANSRMLSAKTMLDLNGAH